MKNNTNKVKQLLELSLREMPYDFALQDARLHIAKALKSIRIVEEKRAKRSSTLTAEQRWKLDMQTGSLTAPPLSPQQKIDVLSAIDQMIAEEENRIKKNNEPDDTQTFLG